MSLNPLIDSDLTLTKFLARVKELQPQGFRLLSLSLYGNPSDPRLSAVWDKRSGPAWEWFPASSAAQLKAEYDKKKALGFYPTLVTATGGGAGARLSAVFEKLVLRKPNELTFDQDVNAFAAEVRSRAESGWMVKAATIYDDAANASRVAAVWVSNPANVAWTAFAGVDTAQLQQQFNAEYSGWARMAFVTGSTSGKFLAVFRDDQLGPIGTGFATRGELTLEQFLSEQKAQLEKGFYTVCFQGYGPDSARRYAAIFVNNETPVQRVAFVPTGGPAVKEIDDAVLDLMKRSNIRGAALAIVKGTRLVLARGYTWAEPDYPAVKPTTCFRLASGSKLVVGLAIHQLVAEGLLKLSDTVSAVLPLTPPPNMTVANDKYKSGTVAQLLEESAFRMERYESEGPNVAAAFGTKLPVRQSQIASYMITKPASNLTDVRLDDTGYFFAGQLIKKLRGTDPDRSIMEAVASRLTQPLQIRRVRSARSLLSAQPTDEARYHSRDLVLLRSVMDDARPLVPREYGDENLETMEPSGGLSAAAVDYARILAAMNARPYTPLGRPAVEQMLKSADAVDGHGFDWLNPIDAAKGLYHGPKGGLLQTSQAGIWYSGGDGISYVIVWNGTHTGGVPSDKLDPSIEAQWYPEFIKVLDAAAKQAWGSTDLFPAFGMDPLPQTQDNWRWCGKCQGLFFAGSSPGSCPAGGTHVNTVNRNYQLMHNSKLAYGQAGWRWCKKCQGLFFGEGAPSVCPAGGAHDPSASGNYSLVLNSPYKEHQLNWRWCKKCQGLFFAGQSKGVCPAGAAHDPSASGDYSLYRS